MKRALLAMALLCACAAGAARSPQTGLQSAPRRDPFARTVAPAPAAPPAVEEEAPPPAPAPLHLRALILNGQRSLANIDGDILAAGERARDYQVLRIDAHGVLVARAGKQELLSLNEKEKQ
jgi:hypothetical protein